MDITLKHHTTSILEMDNTIVRNIVDTHFQMCYSRSSQLLYVINSVEFLVREKQQITGIYKTIYQIKKH